MNDHAKKLFEILFEPDEEICVSPNDFGYQSIPLKETMMGPFVLAPQGEKQQHIFCTPAEIKLVAINPIKGARRDENVTAFRTFMLELDDGTLGYQYDYINKLGVPYSACVFSGGKSLHFAITLDRELPSESVWRFYQKWLLNVISLADQQTQNPSRSIRVAGNMRDGKLMAPVYLGKRIELEKLQSWLEPYKAFAPVEKEKSLPLEIPADFAMLPDWVQTELVVGVDSSKGRNNRWYAIGYSCGLLGWDEDDTISILAGFFPEERDFSRREWETTIKSAVRKARNL